MAVHPAARKASPRFAHTEVSASQRTSTHTASSTTAVPRPQNRAPTKPAKERTADILYAIHTSARSAPNSGLAEPNPQATAARGAPALRHPALSRHRKRRGAHRKSRALRAAAAGGAGWGVRGRLRGRGRRRRVRLGCSRGSGLRPAMRGGSSVLRSRLRLASGEGRWRCPTMPPVATRWTFFLISREERRLRRGVTAVLWEPLRYIWGLRVPKSPVPSVLPPANLPRQQRAWSGREGRACRALLSICW